MKVVHVGEQKEQRPKEIEEEELKGSLDARGIKVGVRRLTKGTEKVTSFAIKGIQTDRWLKR